MILENTFTSIPNIIKDYVPHSQPLIEGLIKNFWESEKSIKGINVPMLFIKSSVFKNFKKLFVF
jgi:hypothetical protein